MASIPEKVKADAQLRGITQERLAQAAGLTRRQVNQWLNGSNPNISADAVEQILNFLGFEVRPPSNPPRSAAEAEARVGETVRRFQLRDKSR